MNNSSFTKTTICYPLDRPFRGLFFGDNPFSSDTPLLLAQLSICALVTALLELVFSPLGQSVFISQILAGVIVGSSVLGRIATFRNLLFPVSSFYVVDTFAYFGLMLFLFITGVKTDMSLLQKSGKKAVAVGLCSFSMPLVLNLLFSQLVSISIPMDPGLQRSLAFVASFQAMSSFQVIVCLLNDLKLMNSEVGRLAISSSQVSSICSWLWTVTIFVGDRGVGMKKQLRVLYTFLAIGAMVLFVIFIFRPIIIGIIHRTSTANSLKQSYVCAVFILVLFASVLSELSGQQYLFGPIILGIVIPSGPPLGSALVAKLECFITCVILPIYFVVAGVKIDFSTISARNFFIVELMALSALVWKVFGAMLPSLCYKMPVTDAFYLGLIMSNQGIIEVIILGRAKSDEIIDKESYSIMVLSIVLTTGLLSPIVKFSYKPFKRYRTGEVMSIQQADPYTELRVLACVHYQEHIPSLLNLFEASYPHPDSPIWFYVIYFLELAGRSAPLLVAHPPELSLKPGFIESEHIINVLRSFEDQNRGSTIVYPFTAISDYASMHKDVCSLAAENSVSIAIVLFHKHPAIQLSEGEANAIRTVNNSILMKSRCSVGILIQCGSMDCSASLFSLKYEYRVGVIFLGGPDDREALAYARRMGRHPNIHLTIIHFVDVAVERACSSDMKEDMDIINEYRDGDMMNGRCSFQEELVKDSIGVVSVIKRMMVFFDLIVVGRRHDYGSPLLAGISDWNEFPELGCVGDTLVGASVESIVSVLVVQQAWPRQSVNGNHIFSVRYGDSKAWSATYSTPDRE